MRRRRALRAIGLASAGACLGARGGGGGRGVARADAGGEAAPAAPGALQPSDVVFMYEATPEVYAAYGATVLGWGGTPTPERLKAAAGVAWHGSVGMVTEFAGYHERFPKTWEEGLCRDVHGQPLKVPWLTDQQHQGVPYWWCCTRQPQFRQFLGERVVEIVRAGARGVHVDDHLGSSGALFLGACFCGRCVAAFRDHLAAVPAAERARLGVGEPAAFDYGVALRLWLAQDPAGAPRRVQEHPLWHEWSACQLRAAAAYMLELRALVARTAGRPLPLSANAGLLWANHLADYRAVDYWSAETEHEAASGRVSDRPLFAYRLAEAMGRPYAATATGQDWAFVKETGCSGLVRSWIAGGYAAGQLLMGPHHQWCYTEEKGTHWYDGPAEAYAPLYRFVRANAALFDTHETWADLAVVMPHRSWAAGRERWLAIGEQLAAANVSYRLVVGGDDVIDKDLTRAELAGAGVVLSPATADLLPADRAVVDGLPASAVVVDTVERALAAVRPAVRVEPSAPVRVLPRVSREDVIVHVLNRAYEPETDAVRPLRGVTLRVDRERLAVARGAMRARVLVPGGDATEVALGADGRLVLDLAGPWALVRLARA